MNIPINTDCLRGTGVATITPMKKGRPDLKQLERIVNFQISQGVDYLVCLGTTGEAATLTKEEKETVLTSVVEVSAGRVPVVLGDFGGSNIKEITDRLKYYDLTGVTALLSSSPAYIKPTQEGIFRFYQNLSEVAPLPIILYNVPARTSSCVHVETTLRLAKSCPKIIGIKDATADLIQASHLIKHKPKDFLVLSGDDPTALPLLLLGGDGVISVLANALPNAFSSMVKAAIEGNIEIARALHFSFLDLHPWLYREGNPTGIKGAMEILGYGAREVRLPLVELTITSMKSLRLELNLYRQNQD